MKYHYGIYVDEGQGERLIWMALEPNKWGRQFFYSGTGILPCIYGAEQSTRSVIKKARADFDEGAQFYVRKVEITRLP